jgi:hypothetical protein
VVVHQSFVNIEVEGQHDDISDSNLPLLLPLVSDDVVVGHCCQLLDLSSKLHGISDVF